MKKPWEEDWTYTMTYEQTLGAAIFRDGCTWLAAMEWETEPDEARIKLATQAPAMARWMLSMTHQMGALTPEQCREAEEILKNADVIKYCEECDAVLETNAHKLCWDCIS